MVCVLDSHRKIAMTINIECGECGKEYQMSDDKAGRRFRCRGCNTVVHVPDDWSDQEDAYDEPYTPRRKPAAKKKRRASKPKSSRGLIIGSSAGAVLVLGIVVVVVMSGTGSEDTPSDGGDLQSNEENAGSGASTSADDSTETASADSTSQTETAATGGGPVLSGVEQNDSAPFDVEQYLKDRSPPADNAAPLYLPALKRIGEVPGLGELADTGKLVSGATSPARIEQALSAAAPALRQIDEAQLKPECVFVVEMSFDAILSHVQHARQVARASLLELYLAEQQQDAALRELAIKRTLRLSRDLQPRGFLISQLVSITMDRIILDGVLKFTLTDRNLTVEQCDRLLALLVEHQQASLNRYEEAMHVEYIMNSQTVEDVGSGRRTAKEIKNMLGISLPEKLNIDAERAACNRLFAAAFQDARTPYHQFVKSNRFDKELSKLAAQFKANPADAAVLAPGLAASFPSAREQLTGSEAQLAGMQMLTAVLRFKLSHGKLPDSPADAAAETTLNTVPADPFSGEPIKYVVLAGRPVVYSVGKDLKDDGGRTDWKSGRQPGDYIFTTR